jgi:hypothetical protein
VQRLAVMVAVMVAVMASRERRVSTRTAAAGDECTALAAALGALRSGVLLMVAEAVAALGYADVPGFPPRVTRGCLRRGSPGLPVGPFFGRGGAMAVVRRPKSPGRVHAWPNFARTSPTVRA